MDPRLRRLADLSVAEVRGYAGRHEYDGCLQDLSPDAVARQVAALGGPSHADPHDEAHLAAFEAGARVQYGELQLHRRDPGLHLAVLDLAGYDRDYAPVQERAEARRRHLAGWPDAVDAALEALDRVPRDVALGLLPAVRGLAAGVTDPAALAGHARFVAHVEQAAALGDPDPALGDEGLSRWMGVPEATHVDLAVLQADADAERDRLLGLLQQACERIAPWQPWRRTRSALDADPPDAAGVLVRARALTAEVLAWTAASGLVPYNDGTCLVGPSPPSRADAMASLSWSCPGEPEGPSWFYVTPPDPAWPAQEQQEWLAVFGRATLPAVCLHEVAPGHFSHSRALRRVPSPVRRLLLSPAFVEGWAHYAEEMAYDEGFSGGDPYVLAGVAVEALVRVTRLTSAIGVHRRTMTVAESAQLFTEVAGLQGPAALSEARRAAWDPTYGRYTWGKLTIRRLRDEVAPADLGGFHRDLLALGAPPLGLLGAARG